MPLTVINVDPSLTPCQSPPITVIPNVCPLTVINIVGHSAPSRAFGSKNTSLAKDRYVSAHHCGFLSNPFVSKDSFSHQRPSMPCQCHPLSSALIPPSLPVHHRPSLWPLTVINIVRLLPSPPSSKLKIYKYHFLAKDSYVSAHHCLASLTSAPVPSSLPSLLIALSLKYVISFYIRAQDT